MAPSKRNPIPRNRPRFYGHLEFATKQLQNTCSVKQLTQRIDSNLAPKNTSSSGEDTDHLTFLNVKVPMIFTHPRKEQTEISGGYQQMSPFFRILA